jgi:hypothetical protein
MVGERAGGLHVAEFRGRVGASARDQRVRIAVGVAFRMREKPRIGMERRRDDEPQDGFLRRIVRAAGRQNDGGALRKPGQQKPQKEVMSKMMTAKAASNPSALRVSSFGNSRPAFSMRELI